MKTTTQLPLLGLALAALSVSQLSAANVYWNTTTTGLWATGANWSNDATIGGTTGALPANGDTVVFNQSSINGNEMVQLNAAQTIAGITFANTGTTRLESSTSTAQVLTLTSALTVNSGAGEVTIGDATNALNVNLGSNSITVTLNSASGLTFANTVTHSAGGANMAFTVNGAGNTLTMADYNLASTGTGKTVTIGGSGNVRINGAVSESSSTGSNLTYGGTGTLTLAGNNTYTGVTTISGGGTVSVSNIVVSGGSSGLGNATSAVVFSNGIGGKLSYTGDSATFTRGFTFNNNNTIGQINMTTAGQTLTIATGNIALSAGSQTLIIGGAGNTTVSSLITGLGKLIKQDAGTLLLTGANTYTGATVINGGTLAFGVSNALATTSALTLGGGTLNLGGFSQATFTNVLTMTAGSTIDFGSHITGLTLKFKDSHTTTWTGTLSLLNFTVGTDNLSFTSISGLTVDQLAQISLAGYVATGLNASGNVQFSAVPEPATSAALVGLAACGFMALRRRRVIA